MEFKTYHINGDNVYIASPLGLAELNRDYPLFLDEDHTKACEELLVAKSNLDSKIQELYPNPTSTQEESPSKDEQHEAMQVFFLKLGDLYSKTMNFLNNIKNSDVPDFFKNKTIYIVTSPEAFQVIPIQD
jgi:hypothetical protein